MTSHERFQQRVQALSDHELIDKADNILRKLCASGGRSFIMTVPPSIDDSDIILSEIIRRFGKTLEAAKAEKP